MKNFLLFKVVISTCFALLKIGRLSAMVVILAVCQVATAQVIDGQSLKQISLEEVLRTVPPGTVLLLGELHGAAAVSDRQVQVIEGLKALGRKVSVAMEFFEYPQQSLVNLYRHGKLAEQDFLQQIKWGGYPFDLYRRQSILGEITLAINAPRWLTSKVSKQGLEGLTKDELSYLPPQFELGQESYRKRFEKVMSGHVPAEALQKYFIAQSIWDDTMAWVISQYMGNFPDHILVVVVGEFHTQYGGGLPDRLRRRWTLAQPNQIQTLSFVNPSGLDEATLLEQINPHGPDGKRADFIWLTAF